MSERNQRPGGSGPSSSQRDRYWQNREIEPRFRARRRSASPVPLHVPGNPRGRGVHRGVDGGEVRGRGHSRRGRGAFGSCDNSPDLDEEVRLDSVEIRYLSPPIPDWQISQAFTVFGPFKRYSRDRSLGTVRLEYEKMKSVDALLNKVSIDGYWKPDTWWQSKADNVVPWPAKLGIRRIGEQNPRNRMLAFPPFTEPGQLRSSLTSDPRGLPIGQASPTPVASASRTPVAPRLLTTAPVTPVVRPLTSSTISPPPSTVQQRNLVHRSRDPRVQDSAWEPSVSTPVTLPSAPPALLSLAPARQGPSAFHSAPVALPPLVQASRHPLADRPRSRSPSRPPRSPPRPSLNHKDPSSGPTKPPLGISKTPHRQAQLPQGPSKPAQPQNKRSQSLNKPAPQAPARPPQGSSQPPEGPAMPPQGLTKSPSRISAQPTQGFNRPLQCLTKPPARPASPAWGVSWIEWSDQSFLGQLADSKFKKDVTTAVTIIASRFGTVTQVLLDRNPRSSRVIYKHPREAAQATLACAHDKEKGGFQALGINKIELRFIKPQAIIMTSNGAPQTSGHGDTQSIDGLQVVRSVSRVFKPAHPRTSGASASAEMPAPADLSSRLPKPVNALAARLRDPPVRRVFETTPAADRSWREGTAVPIIMPNDRPADYRTRRRAEEITQHPADALLSGTEHWSSRPHKLLLYVDGEVEVPEMTEDQEAEENELLGTFDRYAQNLRDLEARGEDIVAQMPDDFSGDELASDDELGSHPQAKVEVEIIERSRQDLGEAAASRKIRIHTAARARSKDGRLSSEDVEMELAPSPVVKAEPQSPTEPPLVDLPRPAADPASRSSDPNADSRSRSPSGSEHEARSPSSVIGHAAEASTAELEPIPADNISVRSPSMAPPDHESRALPRSPSPDLAGRSLEDAEAAADGMDVGIPSASISGAPQDSVAHSQQPHLPQQPPEQQQQQKPQQHQQQKQLQQKQQREQQQQQPQPQQQQQPPLQPQDSAAASSATSGPTPAKRPRTDRPDEEYEVLPPKFCRDESHATLVADLVAERIRSHHLEQRLADIEIVGHVRNVAYAPFVRAHASHLSLEGREAYVARLKERMENAAQDLLDFEE